MVLIVLHLQGSQSQTISGCLSEIHSRNLQLLNRCEHILHHLLLVHVSANTTNAIGSHRACLGQQIIERTVDVFVSDDKVLSIDERPQNGHKLFKWE